MAARGRPPKVTEAQWVAAALTAIAEGGLAAVAIEPLAARLGATKGSFYGYFPNRESLVEAALAAWELATEEAAAGLVGIDEPHERLVALTRAAYSDMQGSAVSVALLAEVDHPLAGPFVRRVTERRLGTLAACFEALGRPPAVARDAAFRAYSAYLGAAALRRALPDLVPADDGALPQLPRP